MPRQSQSDTPSPGVLMSPDDAGPLVGACGETIRRMIRRGDIPYYRVGRHLKVDPVELREVFRVEPKPKRARRAKVEPDFDALG